jgi:spermidine synthase
MATTIVEIDPAVYQAAREYFGLVDPGSDKVFLEDARSWVQKTKEKLTIEEAMGIRKGDTFDIVVHDCFSGGGVPAHIFTMEFWEDLKAIMNPEGVVAVVR